MISTRNPPNTSRRWRWRQTAMFKKILIANRGEIGLRIIRSCKEMGIRTVAVWSEADKDSLHIRFADEDVCIGPAPARESYLNIHRIMAAAEITNADAIHPGYGFLAENPEFSEVCEQSNIVFIGPSAEMIRQMGDKSLAKFLMEKAGVPIVPGSDGVLKDPYEALELAVDIGFPVILKASAGGGGKGMRIVNRSEDLKKAFEMAQLESERAFGRSDLYMEKYLSHPRHVEIQILGDESGNVVAFGERDCTVQRRHQKLVEESPSPAVNPTLRKKLGDAAINGARQIGYLGAGTVEFLLDEDGSFYFMEMNTRIQVEHPVTEMVHGIDLVREQIRIAAGEKIDIDEDTLQIEGHSIECRINAEDSRRDFMPSPGRITSFHIPGGPGVRVDTHAYMPYEIPPHYDSLVAKLVVHDRSRDEAILRMLRALEEFIIEGIATTIPFHKTVLSHPRFIAGDYDTHFIDQMDS
jgi:acetyl-CoA carboxylase biotin carboxylase subunit